MWGLLLKEGAGAALLRADVLQVVEMLSLCSVKPGATVGPASGAIARDCFGCAMRCRGPVGGGGVTCSFAFGCAFLRRDPFPGL